MTDTRSSLRERGMAAVASLARDLDLPAEDLVVLSDRGNLIVQLRPADVVARVCTLTALTRADPAAWMRREVEIAGYGSSVGAPVVPPMAEPGPFIVDGMPVTLWNFVEGETGPPTAIEAGRALAELHLGLAGCPAELPMLAPAGAQIIEGLDALERAGQGGLADRLRGVHRRLADLLTGDPIVLHGDAHPGNLIRSRGRLLWIDLEETCRGPREWDLACLLRSRRVDGSAAVGAYVGALGIECPSSSRLEPFAAARELEAAVWALGMATQDPERYDSMATALVAAVFRR